MYITKGREKDRDREEMKGAKLHRIMDQGNGYSIRELLWQQKNVIASRDIHIDFERYKIG